MGPPPTPHFNVLADTPSGLAPLQHKPLQVLYMYSTWQEQYTDEGDTKCFLMNSASHSHRWQPRSICCFSQKRAKRSRQTVRTLVCAAISTPRNTLRSHTVTIQICFLFSIHIFILLVTILIIIVSSFSDQRNECRKGMDRARDTLAIRGKTITCAYCFLSWIQHMT